MEIAIFKYKDKKHIFLPVTEEDCIFNTLKRGSFYEGFLLEAIKHMDLNGTYIDLGANIGNHSVFFAEHCPSDKVICVEINKEICDVLNLNMRINTEKDFEVLSIGISDKQGAVTLSDILPDNVGMTKIIDYDKGIVPVDTMDNLFGDLANITLIKIDIEGAEIPAIKGMSKVLAKNKPVLFVELHTKALLEEFIELVKPFGYTTNRMNYAATPTYMFVS